MSTETTEATAPVMVLVTLRGGPLDGLARHVYRLATGAQRFSDPEGSGMHLYRRESDGTWRHVEEPICAAANIAKFRHYVLMQGVTPTREAVVALLSDVAEVERERDEARDALREIVEGARDALGEEQA